MGWDERIENLKKAWYLVLEARNLLAEAHPIYIPLDNILTEISEDLKNTVFAKWVEETKFRNCDVVVTVEEKK